MKNTTYLLRKRVHPDQKYHRRRYSRAVGCIPRICEDEDGDETVPILELAALLESIAAAMAAMVAVSARLAVPVVDRCGHVGCFACGFTGKAERAQRSFGSKRMRCAAALGVAKTLVFEHCHIFSHPLLFAIKQTLPLQGY